MKKLTLFLVATLFSALSFAALNPYAYGLSSELSADKTNLTINYSLNADATGVSVVILDGATEIKTITCNDKKTKGSHSVSIPTSDFPTGKSLTWKVVVTGTIVTKPTLQDGLTLKYCLPRGIGVDRAPESPYFGRIYTTEATAGGTSYHSSEGKGLYVFDADLTPVENSTGGYKFTGGITYGTDDISRVVVSDDGRVFLSRFSPTTVSPVVEVNPGDLNANFKDVFTSIKGKTIGIDVKGAGENLKLVMLSTTNRTITEYDLGTATQWTSSNPSRTYTKKDLTTGKALSLVTDNAYISYDLNDGVWLTQHRATASTTEPTIAHVIPSGVDYNNYDEGLSHNNTSNGGVAVSPDGKQLAVVGAGTQKLTIYTISRASNGKIKLENPQVITAPSGATNHTALEWDYAGNLYVANRSAEIVTFYAMPYSGTVATPCASKYAFSLPAPAQLNPFAYNLTSELSADEKNLTINYSLNAKATSVEWVLMDGNNEVKTVDLASLGLEKGNYTTTISTADFPTFKQLTWKIEVKGVAVSEPTEYPVNYSFYHPSSVDIDNNPENKTFGLLLVNDAMQAVKNETKHADGSTYVGSGFGAGIFAFNPAFEPMPNGDKPGYNGGIEFTTGRADGSGTAYAPRRIRISDDGRIFVTSLNTDGNYLWEVNSENMNEWTPIFKGTLNDNKELVDNAGNFVAAPNNGFDVKGAGENLQLMMYSVNLPGITGAAMSGFRCDEYNLGTATSWATAPSKNWVLGKYAINYTGTQVVYDNEGGIWIASYRGTADDANPGLVHINADGVEDSKLLWNNVRQAGIRFNNDFTKLVVASNNGAAKKATIYTVSKNASNTPILTEEAVINMATVGNNLNDFAWDYAGNLYACGNSSEKLVAWAMPHSSDDVVATPAASKYAFSIGKYTVTVNTNDVNKGTVTGGGEYGAGAVVTLTATPKEGYELLYWSDRSKENPRNITVDGNEALSAYFIKKNEVEPTFSITKVWENTNVPASYTNGYQGAGWDGKIYVKDRWGAAINVYTETGSELYVGTDGLTTETAHRGDQALAIDNAGNIVIRSGSGEFFNDPTQITIYKKGEKAGKVIDFTLLETGRCDFISASGDIYSAEGGYVYFYCNTKTVVNRLKIANGAVADIDVVGGDIPVGVTQNHVIQDIFGNLVAHSRTNGIKALNVITNEASNFYILPNTLKTTTLGGCSFELSGKELWAYNVGTTAYTSEWNLYNVTNAANISNEVLYVKDKTSVGTAANWLNVQVVDEKTAYIYQFCPTVGAAVWKVTRDHIVTATAENGTVEGAGTYKDNATATLTATANDGYVFKNWTKNGSVVSTDNPYSFTVTEDVELVANFDGPFCELILNTNDEAKGTVSGAGFYTQGQTATITATPAAGYKLLYWSDRSTQNPRTITMNKKEALSAYFVKVYDEEPTFAIEKVWENTNVPGSADGYQAVGWDGKIYMQNKTAGKIKVYSNGTDAAVDYATSNTSGQQIAIDEAGNLIVFNATFYSATPNAIQIYQKGSTTAKAINFTLPNPGRCDFLSASGDIYSAEGGYVYFYCNTQTVVNRVKITNGAVTASDVTIDVVGSNISTANSTSHIMVDIFGNLLAHARSNNNLYAINVLTDESKLFVLPSHKYSTLGGCSFELGGKELWAYNAGTTNYSSEWNIYNMTDGEFLSAEVLYAVDKENSTNNAANWLNVEVVDENTAYIYQFCPKKAVAVWKVSLINTVVIDDKAVNSIALDEYDGQTVTAKVTRAFNNDSYKTLTLPFDMDEEQIKAVFGETAKVHEFTSVGEANDMFYLHFDPTTTIEAGKPYILQLPTTDDYDAKDGFTIEGVTINTTLNPVVQGAITMQPILDGGGRLDQASQYWLASDNYLYSAGAHPTALLGLRAYFINSTGKPIRARVVYGENEATSIPTVVAPEESVRKVMKDGQIIIIRGEKQYNIQGQVIE